MNLKKLLSILCLFALLLNSVTCTNALYQASAKSATFSQP